MWFLFQNAGVGPCPGNCDAISERFSTRWLDNARAGIEEGHLMPDHVHMLIFDSTRVCGVTSGWVHQGEEHDPCGARLW